LSGDPGGKSSATGLMHINFGRIAQIRYLAWLAGGARIDKLVHP